MLKKKVEPTLKSNKLQRFTVADVLSWNPCKDYKKGDIKKLFGRRKYADALMVLRHPDILDKDKLRVVLRPKVIPEMVLHGLACDFAAHVLPIFEAFYPDDKRPREAIRVKRRWIRGKATDEELDAAGAAAGDAAWAAAEAAWYAAGAAAGDAAWAAWYAAGAAAGDAAWAAWYAAWAAARDAAEAVAGDAAVKYQVGRCIKVIEKWTREEE